jgi:hypothetical protein
MKHVKLTSRAARAHKAPMELAKKGLAGAVLMAGLVALPGCITVNAPEDAIVIELNINITQEVIYRLAEDVRQNIEENPEIF